MNYYKQLQRRNRIASNYERSLGLAKGAPLLVKTVAPAVAYRPVTEIALVNTKKFGWIDVSSDGVRSVKRVNGKKRITYK